MRVSASDDRDIWFYVLVKSSNYSQNNAGELKLLNYHFFSEIFPTSDQVSVTASIVRHNAPIQPLYYHDRGKTWYVEGGHFPSLAAVDAAYPNGDFTFSIKTDKADISSSTLSLAGKNGASEIPKPITIYLEQEGERVEPDNIDPGKGLTISWSPYSNGGPGPNGILDDMIFVVVQDCRGERIVHTGLPFKNKEYLNFRETNVRLEGGRLRPGEPYAMFVEFPHVVDSAISDGIPGFTSFATATYLDLTTTGKPRDKSCLQKMPAMDTGQTDRKPN